MPVQQSTRGDLGVDHPTLGRAVDQARRTGLGGHGQAGLIEAERVLEGVLAHAMRIDQRDRHGDRAAPRGLRPDDYVQRWSVDRLVRRPVLANVGQPIATRHSHIDSHGAHGQLAPTPPLLLLGHRPGLSPLGCHRAPLGVDRIVGRYLRVHEKSGSDGRVHGERQPHGGGASVADIGRTEFGQRFFDVPASPHERSVVEAVVLGRVLLERPPGLGIGGPREQHSHRIGGDRRILGQNLVGGARAEQVPAELLDETFPERVVGGVRAGPVRHPTMPSCVFLAARR